MSQYMTSLIKSFAFIVITTVGTKVFYSYMKHIFLKCPND